MIDLSDAAANLSRLIDQALQGEEVIIGKAGKPVVRLVPYDADPSPRQLGAGAWKGQIWIADDFDELPEEVLALFTGGQVNRPDPDGAGAGREAHVGHE